MENLFETIEIKNQLEERNLTPQNIQDQIYTFEKGLSPVKLVSPCTADNGIISLNEKDIEHYIQKYNANVSNIESCKFVPASGAATRMFKDIVSEYSGTEDYSNQNSPNINKLIDSLTDFAFFNEMDIESTEGTKRILDKILLEAGLNYLKLPKGLIKFHKYPDSSRTAFEEHLVESREYIGDESGNCNIHFTVSPEYRLEIENYLEAKLYDYQNDNIKFNLSYSIQNPATDTVAVDMNNKPIVNENGELTFRPAGHGALINNLNIIDADIIFIKNIDNVTTEKYLPETVKYKKVLGGYLISIKNKINEILLELESVGIDKDKLSGIKEFISRDLNVDLPDNLDTEYIKNLLNRPIRVCGVVRNEGEPGGGPFWLNNNGINTKQIVESAQVDMADDSQKEIWNSSTHFNPVDIVCSVRDYKGEKFDLDNFIDKDAGIITTKSANGREIKALELPGLWNGAMADWITLFIEVPLITFNPVKTVFDLLRKEHRN